MFKIQMFADGRWQTLGGTYATVQEADEKIWQYKQHDARSKGRAYRVVPV